MSVFCIDVAILWAKSHYGYEFDEEIPSLFWDFGVNGSLDVADLEVGLSLKRIVQTKCCSKEVEFLKAAHLTFYCLPGCVHLELF